MLTRPLSSLLARSLQLKAPLARLPLQRSPLTSLPSLIVKMSTATPFLNDYLIILPDHPSVLQKRLSVRAQHFTDLNPDIEAAKITFGGSMLEEPIKPGDEGPPKMLGSAMLISAASQEEAMERVKNDIYTKAGVWDLSKVQIWPVSGSAFTLGTLFTDDSTSIGHFGRVVFIERCADQTCATV